MPKYIWEEIRYKDLNDAISNYVEAGMYIPYEWIEEFEELTKGYNDRREKAHKK